MVCVVKMQVVPLKFDCVKFTQKKTEIKPNFSRFFHGVKSEIIYIILVNFVILNLISKALKIGIYR